MPIHRTRHHRMKVFRQKINIGGVFGAKSGLDAVTGQPSHRGKGQVVAVWTLPMTGGMAAYCLQFSRGRRQARSPI